MSTIDTGIILDGITISKYQNFRRIIQPNETTSVTLGGNIYTDFRNNRRSWVVSWDRITREDFEEIYNIWFAQYLESRYVTLSLPGYGLILPVKMDLSEQAIKYNASVLTDFSITLTEQFAFS